MPSFALVMAHFGKVAETYLSHVREGGQPEWEQPNMLTKYYVTTHALARAEASPSLDKHSC